MEKPEPQGAREEQAYIKGQRWAWERVLHEALTQLRGLGVPVNREHTEAVLTALAEREVEELEMLKVLRARVIVLLNSAMGPSSMWSRISEIFDEFAAEPHAAPPLSLLEELRALPRETQLEMLASLVPDYGSLHVAGETLKQCAEAFRLEVQRARGSGPEMPGPEVTRVVLEAAVRNWESLAK